MTKGLKILRLKYAQNPIIAQININSIRNKFELLVPQIPSNIDVLIISEMKIDVSFTTSQFSIDGFSSPYRLDRNLNGGDILVCFKNDIITKSLKNINLSIEAIFIEMNLRSKKWLLYFTYNPKKSLLERHLNQIQAQLEIFCKNYEHLLIPGDFSANISELTLTSFCTLFKLKNLVKEPTCYKNPNNPSCIDLFLTNCTRTFHSTCVF